MLKLLLMRKESGESKFLTMKKPDIDVILLDDAFQHRSVKPGISILLTDYHNLYVNDYVLPTGN